MRRNDRPEKQGLYDPRFEHDACGVGFVCDIQGRRSNRIVQQAVEVLRRLSHRGATGADPKTGDGAGILIQIPHAFFKKVAAREKIDLPAEGSYGTGLVFLPTDRGERARCKKLFAAILREEGLALLGWRTVPVDTAEIGQTARRTLPVIEQPFIAANAAIGIGLPFERKLYLVRKRLEHKIGAALKEKRHSFYVTNLSARTFSYKGLLMPDQVARFFTDLGDPAIETALALVHSRYSTNTFPTWDLAQPFRFLAHNGEINTLRGNSNWMAAREGLLTSAIFGDDLKDLLPVIVPGGSDSAAIDNVFEFLVMNGRPIEHVMSMLIPPAWERHDEMDPAFRAFYRYHRCLMEPWDGPAAIAFTDGMNVGAVLDRNGLRPARYIITDEGLVIMASEAGVADIAPSHIVTSGRLEPGRMLFIDTVQGSIVENGALKERLSSHNNYQQWLADKTVALDDLPQRRNEEEAPGDTLTFLKAFGYTREDLKQIIRPMVEKAAEPVGSMGNDTPHAVLSQRPQMLFNYFKQLFAQVTNPPIDPIREEIVMSLDTYLGSERNLLDETPEHCHRLIVKTPVLAPDELAAIRHIDINGFKTKTLSTLFAYADDPERHEQALTAALERICGEAVAAIRQGYSFLIINDRGTARGMAAVPILMAVGAVHHHLVRHALRTRISIIVESAEPREVHHFALLFGYGADCVSPYGAWQAIDYLRECEGMALSRDDAIAHYVKAVTKGILKVLSKMGISTLQSYRGAQIFEALGLSDEVIARCFTDTVSRIGGVGFKTLADECIARFDEAYPRVVTQAARPLESGGLYQWKKDGEFHLWNPETIAALQDAARADDYVRYKAFAAMINDQSKNPCTLRSLLRFSKTARPIPIEEVEPAAAIVKRFASGAMSFGSISRSAHETIACAMNRLGGRSNTGEGGEDPARFLPLPNGDSKRSAIKQVASGRFGVTTNYLVNADEIQIKIAQGAKPGEGGQLPGHKVSVTIARTRYTTPGVTLISPPPHHDIYSIEDLAQLIFDLKNVNPSARISVKLVSEAGVGTVAAGVAKGHADMILIAGGDGGTGASPLSSIRHAGLPWELGLAETHQTLVLNDLRSRVRLQADGQMRTGRDVAIAAALGAEEFGFATALLIVCGCVMLRHCHFNNCSVGVATQDELLERRFSGRPEYIVSYLTFVAEEVREIMASLGVRRLDDMVGRTDLLEPDPALLAGKADGIDFSRILYKPDLPDTTGIRCTKRQDHGIDRLLDLELIRIARDTIAGGRPVRIERAITNTDRTTGAMLSGVLCAARGEDGLPPDSIYGAFTGVAGQSFGAFLAKGITFELEGLANDYVGKGLSGGKIVIYPSRKAAYAAEENVIIGNTAFYGASSGEAYIRGRAGERFCIRNSGLHAVVEGLGDHGCEYMTGGRVVVLGKTGRNFAAGMSGGIAYLYTADRDALKKQCNLEMVELEAPAESDRATIRTMLASHYRYTASPVARSILSRFDAEITRFVKIIPKEYKRILEQRESETPLELVEVSDG